MILDKIVLLDYNGSRGRIIYGVGSKPMYANKNGIIHHVVKSIKEDSYSLSEKSKEKYQSFLIEFENGITLVLTEQLECFNVYYADEDYDVDILFVEDESEIEDEKTKNEDVINYKKPSFL